MRKGNILPIALMAMAIVGFLLMVDYSISGGKWPWSAENTNETTKITTNAAVNVNAVVNTNINAAVANGNTNSTAMMNTNATTNTSINNNANTNSNVAAASSCSYEPPIGWLTYTNASIGYRINYPPDWIVSVINNPPDEMFTQPVKYITITKGSYFLAVGVRHTNDTFLTSDRTGVGAGDFQPAGSEMICDTSISASKLVFENKSKEWFYSSNGPGVVTVDNHQVNAALSYSGAGAGYDNLNMTNSTELGLARQIMKTLFFTN